MQLGPPGREGAGRVSQLQEMPDPGVRRGRPDSRGEARISLAYAGGSFLFEAAKVL
jgi:hypothetical protein